jgi:hypothetical protein
MNKNLNYEIIKMFSGQENILTTPRIYVDLTGSHSKAFVLNQIVFYSNKSSLSDGWFYKSYKDWQKDISVSESTLKRIIKYFHNQEIIETRTKKIHGTRVLHIKLNFENLISSIADKLTSTNIIKKYPICDNDIQNKNVQKLPQSVNMTLSNDLYKSCPKVSKWPNGQSVKMTLSSLYTDKSSDTTTTACEGDGNTCTQTESPVVVVIANSKEITTQLQTAYQEYPFTTESIKTESDFLSACEYSINHRNDGKQENQVTEKQRARGIVKLLKMGTFEEPHGWVRKSPVNKKKVDDRIQAQEEASLKKWHEEEDRRRMGANVR